MSFYLYSLGFSLPIGLCLGQIQKSNTGHSMTRAETFELYARWWMLSWLALVCLHGGIKTW